MRSEDLGRSGLRLRVVCAALLACFALLAVRAAQLSMIDPRPAERACKQIAASLRLPAARGLIMDRAGAELAVTVSVPSVYAIRSLLADPQGAARAIAAVLGCDAASVRKRLDQDAPFTYVKRWVSREQADAIRALGLPGVGIVSEPRRAYPQRGLAGRLLGFANIDGQGARGIEQKEDSWLRGKAQLVTVERDAHGQRLVTSGLDPRSAAGGDVILTLDAALQAEIDASLEETIAATGSRGGIVVSLDPRTGDILALAERPGFDPNRFRTTPFAATRSGAFLDAVEPGSSLKPFVIAAALQHGAVSEDERIDCESGRFRIRGKTLRDRKPFGVMDLPGVLRVSSNICAAKIGFQVGAEAQFETLRRFGFGAVTGSGFPDESAGLLRSWRNWREVDHATISYGQGIGVTPVQLAAATAALANRGVWLQPRLVAARREAGGSWRELEPAPQRRAVRAEVADAVLRMMETVVSSEGTGRRAALQGVRVAGKTGTAQKLDAATGTYSTKSYLAWFTGVAPADDPRIVIVVMLDEPSGLAHTGGATAAPLFARVAAAQLVRHGILTRPELPLPLTASAQPDPNRAEKMVRTEGAPPPRTSLPASRGERETQPGPMIATLRNRVLLPDFIGLSTDEVRRATIGIGLEVEMLGRGRAVSQDPAPGTILAGSWRRVRVRFASLGEDG